eukprot:3929280-Rhodomonas_salina.1
MGGRALTGPGNSIAYVRTRQCQAKVTQLQACQLCPQPGASDLSQEHHICHVFSFAGIGFEYRCHQHHSHMAAWTRQGLSTGGSGKQSRSVHASERACLNVTGEKYLSVVASAPR